MDGQTDRQGSRHARLEGSLAAAKRVLRKTAGPTVSARFTPSLCATATPICSLQGPDPVGGYPDPENPAQMMTVEEHVARGYSRNYEREWSSVADKPAGAKQFAELYDGKLH